MNILTYTVKIKKIGKEGFMVTVPKLPGCVTWGKTYEEAVSAAQDAIMGFVQALVKARQSVPTEVNRSKSRSLTMFINAPVSI